MRVATALLLALVALAIVPASAKKLKEGKDLKQVLRRSKTTREIVELFDDFVGKSFLKRINMDKKPRTIFAPKNSIMKDFLNAVEEAGGEFTKENVRTLGKGMIVKGKYNKKDFKGDGVKMKTLLGPKLKSGGGKVEGFKVVQSKKASNGFAHLMKGIFIPTSILDELFPPGGSGVALEGGAVGTLTTINKKYVFWSP